MDGADRVRVRDRDSRGQEARLSEPVNAGHLAVAVGRVEFRRTTGASATRPAWGRMTVTPVRTGPRGGVSASGPSPSMRVTCPTSTPSTSVIALSGPGVPVPIAMPRSRARTGAGAVGARHAASMARTPRSRVTSSNARVSVRAWASRGRGMSTSTTSATRPGRAESTTTRSERNTASAIECVTNRLVLRSGQMRSSSPCRRRVYLVERPERLVHQQDLRVDRQRPSETRRAAACRPTARRAAVLEPVELEVLEELVRALAPPIRRPPDRNLQRQLDVLADRPPVHEHRLLEDHREPVRLASCCGRAAFDQDRAVVGGVRSVTSRRSVDLPEPDGPISETNSPRAMARSTRSSAWTASGPSPNVLETLRSSTTGPEGVIRRRPRPGEGIRASYATAASVAVERAVDDREALAQLVLGDASAAGW